jgi:hypothetical protein
VLERQACRRIHEGAFTPSVLGSKGLHEGESEGRLGIQRP